MAKRPTLTKLTSGYYSTTTLTNNFTAIEEHFDNFVSRDASSPNAFGGDLDMNSNDILNVGAMDAATLTVNGINITDRLGATGYSEDLNGLTLQDGDMLYYDGSQLNRLAIGTNGQVLKVASGALTWGTDIDTDTDTDTVGVTIEEDGSEVSTTVTVINFVTGGANAVTDTGSGSVEVDLTALVN